MMDITMVLGEDWRQCSAMVGGAVWIQKRCKEESRLERDHAKHVLYLVTVCVLLVTSWWKGRIAGIGGRWVDSGGHSGS